jgi:hypothetical protein
MHQPCLVCRPHRRRSNTRDWAVIKIRKDAFSNDFQGKKVFVGTSPISLVKINTMSFPGHPPSNPVHSTLGHIEIERIPRHYYKGYHAGSGIGCRGSDGVPWRIVEKGTIAVIELAVTKSHRHSRIVVASPKYKTLDPAGCNIRLFGQQNLNLKYLEYKGTHTVYL